MTTHFFQGLQFSAGRFFLARRWFSDYEERHSLLVGLVMESSSRDRILLSFVAMMFSLLLLLTRLFLEFFILFMKLNASLSNMFPSGAFRQFDFFPKGNLFFWFHVSCPSFPSCSFCNAGQACIDCNRFLFLTPLLSKNFHRDCTP